MDYVTVAVTSATPYDPTSRPSPHPVSQGAQPACAAPGDPVSLLNFSLTDFLINSVFLVGISPPPHLVILWGDQWNGGGVRSLGTQRHLHHDSGAPAHSFGG